MTSWRIRDETPADVAPVRDLTVAAFAGQAYSQQTEHFVVEALRRSGALAVSLVAEEDGVVVGHIAFSPVELSDGTDGWYGLGPVSVLPSHQRRGIGAALIRAGLERLRQRGARGCCLVGHPAYYGRFGFQNFPGLGYPGAPPEVVFAQSFDGHRPTGTIAFHAAFGATADPAS